MQIRVSSQDEVASARRSRSEGIARPIRLWFAGSLMSSQSPIAQATIDSKSTPPTQSVPPEYIANHLTRSFGESVRPVGYGLSFLFFFFAFAHPYTLGARAKPL